MDDDLNNFRGYNTKYSANYEVFGHSHNSFKQYSINSSMRSKIIATIAIEVDIAQKLTSRECETECTDIVIWVFLKAKSCKIR